MKNNISLEIQDPKKVNPSSENDLIASTYTNDCSPCLNGILDTDTKLLTETYPSGTKSRSTTNSKRPSNEGIRQVHEANSRRSNSMHQYQPSNAPMELSSQSKKVNLDNLNEVLLDDKSGFEPGKHARTGKDALPQRANTNYGVDEKANDKGDGNRSSGVNTNANVKHIASNSDINVISAANATARDELKGNDSISVMNTQALNSLLGSGNTTEPQVKSSGLDKANIPTEPLTERIQRVSVLQPIITLSEHEDLYEGNHQVRSLNDKKSQQRYDNHVLTYSSNELPLSNSANPTNVKHRSDDILVLNKEAFDQEYKCPKHPVEPIEYYCFTDEEPLCLECMIETQHGDHNVDSINKAKGHIRQKTKEIFLNVKDKIDILGIGNGKLMDKELELNSFLVEAKSTIKDYFSKLHMVIDQKEKEFLGYVVQTLTERIREIKSSSNLIKDKIKSLTEVYNSINKLNQSFNQASFWNDYAIQSKKIWSLLELKEDNMKIEHYWKAANIKYRFNNQSLNDLINTINNIKFDTIRATTANEFQILAVIETIPNSLNKLQLQKRDFGNVTHSNQLNGLRNYPVIERMDSPYHNDQQEALKHEKKSNEFNNNLIEDLESKLKIISTTTNSYQSKNNVINHPVENQQPNDHIRPFIITEKTNADFDELVGMTSPTENGLSLYEKFAKRRIQTSASPTNPFQCFPSNPVRQQQTGFIAGANSLSVRQRLQNLKASTGTISTSAGASRKGTFSGFGLHLDDFGSNVPEQNDASATYRPIKLMISPPSSTIHSMNIARYTPLCHHITIKKAIDEDYHYGSGSTPLALANNPLSGMSRSTKSSLSITPGSGIFPLNKLSTIRKHKPTSVNSNLTTTTTTTNTVAINSTNLLVNRPEKQGILHLLGKQKTEFYGGRNCYTVVD